MRLIDADALLEALDGNAINGSFDADFLQDLITNAPTVQREGWVSVPINIINFGEELESNLSEVFGKDTGRLVAKFSHIAEAEALVRLYKAAAPTDKE